MVMVTDGTAIEEQVVFVTNLDIVLTYEMIAAFMMPIDWPSFALLEDAILGKQLGCINRHSHRTPP